MATITRARCYLSAHPGEALTDALGCVMICAMVALGFTLPAFL